jgi:hypothetical protein
MASPDEALDDMLSEPGGAVGLEDDMADDSDEDDAIPGDDFGMFAADFLDDSLPMADRIEALRSAIMAATGGGMLE